MIEITETEFNKLKKLIDAKEKRQDAAKKSTVNG